MAHDDNLSFDSEQTNSSQILKIPSWSSSAEQIGGTLDILILILVCLPVRSLVRFKVVCKQWFDLISGTRFSDMHASLNPRLPISGFYLHSDAEPIPIQGHSLPKLTFMKDHEQFQGSSIPLAFRIHDSRHGLILCSYCSDTQLLLAVCNPTTQKSKVFPQRGFKKEFSLSVGKENYLSFNPLVSLIYKVILIRTDGWVNFEVAICTSNSLSWKNIRLEGQESWGRIIRVGLLASDGVVYYMTYDSYLVEFDSETEKLSASFLTSEPMMPAEPSIGYFGERENSNLVLILAPEPWEPSKRDFLIYEMNKLDGRKWVLEHYIDLTREVYNLHVLRQWILRDYYGPRGHFGLIHVVWDDERDLSFVIKVRGKVISYNHDDKKTEFIYDLPYDDNQMPFDETSDWDYTNLWARPFIASLCQV